MLLSDIALCVMGNRQGSAERAIRPREETVVRCKYGREYLRVHPRERESVRVLCVCLHGAYGNFRRFHRAIGAQFENFEEDAVVTYPNAINGHWNDGRLEGDTPRTDVDFLASLIRSERERYRSVDTVVLTGHSNGAMMNFHMMLFAQGLVDVFAPVCGLLPKWQGDLRLPKGVKGVKVILIVGLRDNLVPTMGGSVGRFFRGGATESRWGKRANTRAKRKHGEVRSLSDTCSELERMLGVSLGASKRLESEKTYTANARTSVDGRLRVITIDETGHAWPGSRMAAFSFVMGKALGPTATFSAGREILKFALMEARDSSRASKRQEK